MNIAIILAGGSGERVGAAVPKQFIKVLGKPLMIYTLETFQADNLIDEIVLVCIESHMDLARQYCDEYKLNKVQTIIPGGVDFLHSCINGMNSIRDKCKDDSIVVITSADRPFISKEEIDDSIKSCMAYGSGIAARRCNLCMFKVDDNRESSKDYMRENLVQTATPWAFNYKKLLNALDRYEHGDLAHCETYPVAVYVAAGNIAYFSKSFPENIKITEKNDIALMEQMLIEKRGSKIQ